MPNYSSSLKTWGSSGSEYPDNYNYVEGEQPVDAWDNFLTHNVITDLSHLIDVTNNELLARDGSVKINDGATAIPFSDDAGANETLFDMAVSGTPTAGTQESVVAKIDGTSLLKWYAEADGAGGIQSAQVRSLVNFDVQGNITLSGTVDGVDVSDHAADAAAHHTRYTDEEAQDAVGTILGSNFNYDDATPAITLVSDTVTVAGNAVSLGGSTGIGTADLSGDTDGLAEGASNLFFTDERAQDAVGTILGSQFTYDDTNNAITLDQGEGSGLNADQWEGYDLQKDGTDGTGVINFKTS